MKIPFFTQTIQEMFGSKTNYVGLAFIVFGGFQVFKGNVMAGLELLGLGLGLFGIKDAIVKGQMETPGQISDRWWHRKRMAWLAFAELSLTVPMLAVFQKTGFVDDKWMSAMQPVIIAIVGGMLTIIGMYIGFSTLHDIKNREET